jgi:hypothetical protein
MNLLKTLKPFTAKPKSSRENLMAPVRQGKTFVATDGIAMAIYGPVSADGPCVNVESHEEVQFINWQRCQPNPETTLLLLKANRAELLAACEALMSAEKSHSKRGDVGCRFRFRDGENTYMLPNDKCIDIRLENVPECSLACSVKCIVGPGLAEISKGCDLGLSAAYVAKSLKALDCHMVQIHCQPFEAERKAVVFSALGAEEEDLRIVLMPIRLRES